MSEMVDRVARAICDNRNYAGAFDDAPLTDRQRTKYVADAKAAIEAIQLDLINPSVEARKAGAATLNRLSGGEGSSPAAEMGVIAIWQDMLSKALT